MAVFLSVLFFMSKIRLSSPCKSIDGPRCFSLASRVWSWGTKASIADWNPRRNTKIGRTFALGRLAQICRQTVRCPRVLPSVARPSPVVRTRLRPPCGLLHQAARSPRMCRAPSGLSPICPPKLFILVDFGCPFTTERALGEDGKVKKRAVWRVFRGKRNKEPRVAVVQNPWNLMIQVGAPTHGTRAVRFRLPSKNEGQRNKLPSPRATQGPRRSNQLSRTSTPSEVLRSSTIFANARFTSSSVSVRSADRNASE